MRLAARHPQGTALAVLGLLVLILIATKGLHDVAQTGLNGLALGSVYALGAVGLTLVYGILKLVNFAHGDFLTFGAYMAFLVNVTWGGPLVLAHRVRDRRDGAARRSSSSRSCGGRCAPAGPGCCSSC